GEKTAADGRARGGRGGGQKWSARRGGPGAGGRGSAAGANKSPPRAPRLAGNRRGAATGQGGFAVGGHREFQDHVRAAVLHPPDVAGVRPPRLLRADADLDHDASVGQAPMAGAGGLRIGINQRGHHARDAGRDDGVGAGRGLAVMGAWLERDIERRPARVGAGAAERLSLGVGPPTGLGPAAADDHTVLGHHRADGGIGPGAPQAAPAPRARERPEAGVLRAIHPASLNAFNSNFLSGLRFTLYQGAQPHGASMLISGKEKLERMRDGRAIYIGVERVDDVTRHPAFRNAARTIADLYDFKADPDRRDLFSFEDNARRSGLPWLRCRTREDLVRRMHAMKAVADATYGLIGRSPDHVAGLITGLAMKPALLGALTPGFGENLTRYYEHARKNDLYVSFAVTPPAGIRSP